MFTAMCGSFATDPGLELSRPYHPQSRGKNEPFHRTLKA
jgi:hypothetical protein